MIAREPLRLAAARLAADYVWRAQAWACDFDEELVVDLEQVHQRILERIHGVPTLDSEDAVVQARSRPAAARPLLRLSRRRGGDGRLDHRR